jgi:hypothetical protein
MILAKNYNLLNTDLWCCIDTSKQRNASRAQLQQMWREWGISSGKLWFECKGLEPRRGRWDVLSLKAVSVRPLCVLIWPLWSSSERTVIKGENLAPSHFFSLCSCSGCDSFSFMFSWHFYHILASPEVKANKVTDLGIQTPKDICWINLFSLES